MKKRILSLLMVGAMTAGMLAGCGSKTAETSAAATEAAIQQQLLPKQLKAVQKKQKQKRSRGEV